MASEKQIVKKRRWRILAADDDPIMREMMMARLGQDVDVTCAENGEVAWKKLRDENFDLAIIDLGMPKLDGFGLVKYLRQTPKTVDLPIIIATSRGDQEAIEKAFSSGASGFVTKPINWSLFKYDVQFVLKNGLIERQLRAHKTVADSTIRAKNNLLKLMSLALEQQSQNNHGDQTGQSGNYKDLMHLASLEANDTVLNTTKENANTLVENVVKLCRQPAAEKSVKLLGRRSTIGISINVKLSDYRDALYRLTQAAIHSSSAGGTVEIMLGAQPDGSLVISIRNTGQILSQAEVDSRLNIFSNKDIASNIESYLSELDLPIIKRCAEIHGGKALFHNKIAEGNVSALWLPASRVTIETIELAS